MTLEVGGRRAELTHVTNAHTDGDTWIYCMAGCCARAASVPGGRRAPCLRARQARSPRGRMDLPILAFCSSLSE